MALLIQKILFLPIALICLPMVSNIAAQSFDPPVREMESIQGDLIVQWTSWGAARKFKLPFAERRELSQRQRIELLRLDTSQLVNARRRLRADPGVLSVSDNASVDLRVAPNDPNYPESANLRRAGFERAWDLTPGGQTSDGTPIVVAVIDAGFDLNHRDLRDNVWVNPEEIPGNGIDDDGNGFVDDLNGWDFVGNDALLPLDNHGTQVIGQLGAKGDNGQGVAGTNWDIEMMLLGFRDVADVIEAYDYVIEQRRRWNDSNGARGAFVVATNASFGIEGATCATFPAWGAMYDALGEVGILTAAAVANRSWNVDVEGDMPVDCSSEYLLGVANLGLDDRLAENSAYGEEHVDLAAPGDGSYTTFTGGRYGDFSSTSAAAPLVAGAIALLYATPCPDLERRAREAPAITALRVRDVLLSTTKSLLSLRGEIATGGALDVAEAQRIMVEQCGVGGLEDFRIERVSPNPASRRVVLRTNALVFGEAGIVNLYDFAGRLVSRQRPSRLSGNQGVDLQIDLLGLATGVYFVEIIERDRVATSKLIVASEQ